MSEICSEKDCRTILEGERDEFGTSMGMSGEGRAGEEREKISPPCSQNKGYYMPATGGM